MTMYVLVLFFHVGIWGDTDSNATTNIPGFSEETSCIAAGNKAKELVSSSKKELEFTCIMVK